MRDFLRRPRTRRDALCRMGGGFGMLAFASLVNESIAKAGGVLDQAGELTGRALDHPARAKRVIFLFMNGGLSQVDSFDPKPMLAKFTGSRSPAARWRPSARPGRSCSRPSPSRNTARAASRSVNCFRISASASTTCA